MSDAHSGELSRADIEKLVRRPAGIVKQELTIGIKDLASGRGFEGRGVILVLPRHALRMILLGPGGTTAMDVWMRDGRFRVAIPALSRVVRGDAATPRAQMRGMPVDLLWRLLVDPFGSIAFARRGHPDEHGVVSGEGFTAWMRRGPGVAEVRTRYGNRMGAWFFDHGRLAGIATGSETGLGEATVPTSVDYVGLDPAMEVRVASASASLVARSSVSPKVFADPDGE